MGIYDREYYRREGYSVLGSFTERGRMCKWLIGINVVFFIVQLVAREQTPLLDEYGDQVKNPYTGEVVTETTYPFTDALELDAPKVLDGQIWRLLTYAFLHDPQVPFHIIFNMLFLWWFGSDVEDLYGPKEFLALYLSAALLGGVAFTATYWAGVTRHALCIGASGAVTAVLVICALHFPSRIILMWFLPVPIWLFVLFQVAQDLFGFISGHAGRTAVSVHLAGAAFGFFYHQKQWRLLSLVSGFRGWQRQRSRPRLRVYHEDAPQPVSVAAPPQSPDVDEHLEARMDAVLEKVKRSGMNSLTESERQILVRASEVFKRRRT